MQLITFGFANSCLGWAPVVLILGADAGAAGQRTITMCLDALGVQLERAHDGGGLLPPRTTVRFFSAPGSQVLLSDEEINFRGDL